VLVPAGAPSFREALRIGERAEDVVGRLGHVGRYTYHEPVELTDPQRRTLEGKLSRSLAGPGLLRQARRIGFVRPGERLFIVKGIERWRKEQGKRRATIRRDG